MICNDGFQTDVLVTYGHIESNLNFPAPEQLVNKLSKLMVVGEAIFARRFNCRSQSELTYILFGTKKQQYLIHYLTDDENSFDQILSVTVDKSLLKNLKGSRASLVTVPLDKNLSKVKNNSFAKNNKFSIPTNPLMQKVRVMTNGKEYEVQVNGLIYFNDNSDLHVD